MGEFHALTPLEKRACHHLARRYYIAASRRDIALWLSGIMELWTF